MKEVLVLLRDCAFCKKRMTVRFYDRDRLYCSNVCKVAVSRNKTQRKCPVCEKVFIKRKSTQGVKVYCSLSCRSNATIAKGKGLSIGEFMAIKPIIHSVLWPKRKSSDYKKWRQEIFKRDKICQRCSAATNLIVHHPIPFSIRPDLALEMNNGMVLCVACHKEIHHAGNYSLPPKAVGARTPTQ